jgi:site-specific recombinase XerD
MAHARGDDVDGPTPDRLPGVVVPGPSGWPAIVELFLAGKRGNTRAAYAGDLNQFTTWCRQLEIDPLTATRADLAAFVLLLEQRGRAPSTISRKISAIAGAYRTALVEDVISRSPTTYLERPKVPDETPTACLDRQGLLDVIAASRAHSPLAWALVATLGLNGLRVSEVCGADVSGLRKASGHRVLSVTRKGGKPRLIPLADPTQSAIDHYLAGRKTGPLLRGRDDGRLSRHAAARIVARCGADAGVEDDLTPHSLRHTYVTLCRRAGVRLQDVQESADHADPRTTQRYDHAQHRLDEAPTYRLADYLAGRIGDGGADPQGRLF